jgi:DNA-binding GntR family transcriptional regulator
MNKPLYVELADTLRRQIDDGQLPVGSVLPSEISLSVQHGISRFTARAALAKLERQGYLKRRPRVGTEVLARDPQTSYSLQANSTRDILRFAQTTDLHLVDTQDVNADAVLARDLGCEPGEAWIRVSAYRTSPETSAAVSWTDFYFRREQRPGVPSLGQSKGSLRYLLEHLKACPIDRIDQQIEACTVPKAVAAVLGVPIRSPSLRVVYRTYSPGDQGHSYVAICFYPEGRFRFTQTLMRDGE